MRSGLGPIWLSLLVLATTTEAATPDVHVPDELRPWVDWVLEDKEFLECPFLFNAPEPKRETFICAWPGRLELRIGEAAGRFAQTWTVHAADQWIPLPGDAHHWPQGVTADGRPVEVIARGATPAVRLAPGRYSVSGRFEWDERPRTLAVPRETGLIELFVDDTRIARPDWNRSGVWLGERQLEREVQDALDVQVYRLVSDDVPTRLTAMFRIEVAGSVREELIGPALPDGFIPLAIESGLPARLEPDGNLRLQLRPGSWQLSLHARGPAVVSSVSLSEPAHNLPDAEIWSYRSNDRLRVTAPEALRPVDPIQAAVPDPWRELPAFRITPGEALTIIERSRGKVALDNDLRLNRQLWLDFGGDGYAFSDRIGGIMRSGWRLDMAAPYRLLSAAEAGENLLVTLSEGDGIAGVELRRTSVDLYAAGRSDTRRRMPVTGWHTHFNGVEAELNLPPGHKLLAAFGADRSPESWVERWELLDFFLLLIITIAAVRLFGRGIGAVALFALTLSLHEFGAPAWTWLNLLAAIALVRVAPEGRLMQFLKAYRGLSFVWLLVLLVPFAVGQLRIALYPQLEPQYPGPAGLFALQSRAPEAPMDRAAHPARESTAPELEAREEIAVAAAKAPRLQTFARYAPNAIVQAGPGRPSWRWNTYALSWSGPVDAERTLRLVVMPRWLISGLRFIEVLLLGAFAAVFAFEIFNREPKWPGGIRKAARATAPASSAALLLTACLFADQVVHADIPTAAILEELEKRLTAPPPCAPACAEIAAARVVAGDRALTVELEVHALAEVAVPLPGSKQGWRPEQILVDRVAATRLFRDSSDLLWLELGEGRHAVSLAGPIPAVDSLELPFPAAPRVIRAESNAWFVAGIENRRLISGSLQLSRLQRQGEAGQTARWESSRFPAFVRLEREIGLDLDWTLTTTVYRVAPEQGVLALNVPLLSGESILSENVTVVGNEVIIAMNPDERVISWRSTLPRQSPQTLQARADAPWKEVWRFRIGSVWHAEFEGVPESELEYDHGDVRVAEFFPRAGEALTLIADRPEASPGTTLAFDSVHMQTTVGERSRNVALNLAYRSTRGSQHVIRLPEGAEVGFVSIDGRPEPLRAESGRLTIPILPGEHGVEIGWRNQQPVTAREATPDVDLGAAASNIHLSLELPRNRWVLATSGPRLGPAVMYWSELAALILIAAILGRIDLTPLATRHWVLLGLGFSTFSWYALGIVVIWLLAAGSRRKWRPQVSGWRFNALQVTFALLTLIALASIIGTLPSGLLGTPDMHVAGNGSAGNTLRWFADRSESLLPTASVFTLPLWSYKALILAWALWLSFALIRWLPWVWRCFTVDGLWQSRRGLELSRSAGRDA